MRSTGAMAPRKRPPSAMAASRDEAMANLVPALARIRAGAPVPKEDGLSASVLDLPPTKRPEAELPAPESLEVCADRWICVSVCEACTSVP